MSNGAFITNAGDHKFLDRLGRLVEHSEHLSFLSGFFYFSGTQSLYQSLLSNPTTSLRILVGLEADFTNGSIVEYAKGTSGRSSNAELNSYIRGLTSTFSSREFDSETFRQQVLFFLELLDSGRLEIRKTLEPNHAKLYLFELDKSQVGKRELFITGSSNLTRFGLQQQREFNVEIADYGFGQAASYFEECWDSSVPLTRQEDQRQKIRHALLSQTPLMELTPQEAFLAVIDAYLSTMGYFAETPSTIKEVIEKAGYVPYRYQIDAVGQARGIVDLFGGVVIADVVGLGKSVIGSALASALGKRGVLLAPPGLLGEPNGGSGWSKYLEEFGLRDWRRFSTGDLAGAATTISKLDDVEVVMIDEAHRFRNQDTEAYEALLKICKGKKVILITATPFNNSPSDMLSLLQLFIDPKKSGLTLDGNIKNTFDDYKSEFQKLSYIRANHISHDSAKRTKAIRHAETLFGTSENVLNNLGERSKYLARQIKTTISPVMIRRNRLDIENNPDYAEEVGQLPKLEDPMEWFFEMSTDQTAFYTNVISSIFIDPDDGGRFEGAVYRPQSFLNKTVAENQSDVQEQRQQNIYDFMRRLLVKRFESSFGAFRKSLENFKAYFETSLAFLEEHGKFPTNRDMMRKLESADDAGELESFLSGLALEREPVESDKIYDFSDEETRALFGAAIQRDIATFEHLIEELSRLKFVESDPKSARLLKEIRQLRTSDPGRKIVIFSEYRDTVDYFGEILQAEFPGRTLVVRGDLTKKTLKEIAHNFDASVDDSDNFDILVGTDRLSEGFNLNRAGIVINLDIPWNPVRVIQRVGRINRIGANLFESLMVVNFFPSEVGADLVRSREIAAEKMHLIHNALGEDSKIFDSDESPSPAELYSRINLNPNKLEEEGFLTKVLRRREALAIAIGVPAGLPFSVPPRVKASKPGRSNTLSVFVRTKALHISLVTEKNGQPKVEPVTFEEIFDLVEASSETEALKWDTPDFWKKYRLALSNLAPTSGNSIRSQNTTEAKALRNIEGLIQKPSTHEADGQLLRQVRGVIVESGRISEFTLKRIAKGKSPSGVLLDAHAAGIVDPPKDQDRVLVEPMIVLAIETVESTT